MIASFAARLLTLVVVLGMASACEGPESLEHLDMLIREIDQGIQPGKTRTDVITLLAKHGIEYSESGEASADPSTEAPRRSDAATRIHFVVREGEGRTVRAGVQYFVDLNSTGLVVAVAKHQANTGT
jgi:hypothetical protein